MDHIKQWLRKPNKIGLTLTKKSQVQQNQVTYGLSVQLHQEVRRQLIGQAPGDGAIAVGSPAHTGPEGPSTSDTRDCQQDDVGQSEPPSPVCGRCGLLEEAALNTANHTQHTETENRDDLPPLAPWLLSVRQGDAWPRPHLGERRRALPCSLPSSPLVGRWVGPCLTPPPTRCRVEAALQRSKDAQRAKPFPPQGWEGLSHPGGGGWSLQEEAWRYCLLSPCICLRCPSAPPYQEQDEAAGTTLLYPSLSHMTIS